MMKKILSLLFLIFAFLFNFSTVQAETFISGPHWNKSLITVYIPKDARAMSMRRAFEKWQNVTNGSLKFQFVNKGPANIDVVFTEKVDGNDGPLGSYKLTTKGNYITKAEIKMGTRGNKKYSNDFIYTTMLHEIGHALGLPDETRKPSSIMQMPVSETQDIIKPDVRNLYKLNGWSYKERRSSN